MPTIIQGWSSLINFNIGESQCIDMAGFTRILGLVILRDHFLCAKFFREVYYFPEEIKKAKPEDSNRRSDLIRI